MNCKESGRKGGMAARGDSKRHSKLTWDIVNQIRADDRTNIEIAAALGLHRTTVNRIKRGVVWQTGGRG